MKPSAWRKTWLIGTSLLLNASLAAGVEYSVDFVHPLELREYLNNHSTLGWELKSLNTWTDGCPNQHKTCFVVLMKKE